MALLPFIGIAVLVNFSGLFMYLLWGLMVRCMPALPKLWCSVTTMYNYLLHGTDWLDKPHFPFWITAFSFKLFGFTTWAYKLPGILFMLMGAGYTYLFARKLYNKEVALWAVLILLPLSILSCQTMMYVPSPIYRAHYCSGISFLPGIYPQQHLATGYSQLVYSLRYHDKRHVCTGTHWWCNCR
jgi:hypothetical protein